MCEVGADWDGPAVWEKVWRTAKVPHRCSGCGATIQPGDRYEHTSRLWEGKWEREHACAPCASACEAFGRAHEGEPFPSGLRESLEECVLWDENSAAKWGPVLDLLKARGQSVPP